MYVSLNNRLFHTWSFIKAINGDTTMTMLPTRSNRKSNATGSTEKHDDFHSAPRWQDNKNRKTSLPSKSSLQLEADFRERRVAQLLNYSHDYSVKMFFVNAEHKRNYTTYDVTCALHSDCAPKIRRAQNDFGEAFVQTLCSRSGDVIHPLLRNMGLGTRLVLR